MSGARTMLSGIVRLGSGRFGCIGWTRQSGRLGGRPRYRAGIAAPCSSRAAGRATAAMSAERSPGASVRAAGVRSKTCGVLGVPLTGSGQTGRNGLPPRSGRSKPTSGPHTRHDSARTAPLSPLTPPLAADGRTEALSGLASVIFLTLSPFHSKIGWHDSSAKGVYRDSETAVHPSRRVQHAPGCRDAIRRTGWAADGARR